MPDLSGAAGEQRELIAGLRAVIEAKDAELAALREGFAAVRADLEAERELRRRLELRVAELERRLRDGQLRFGHAAVEGADRGEGAQEGAAARAAVLGAGAAQGPQAGRAARASR